MRRLDKALLKFGLGICFAVVLIVPTFREAVNRPTDPKMCASCHSMESASNSLISSAHKDVTCAQCHLPEAHFSQLALPITDANCSTTDCHPKAAFFGTDLFVSNKNLFDHQTHYKAAATGGAMTCISCHARQDNGEHFSTIINNCFSCHHQEEKVTETSSCEDCHATSVRFLSDEARNGQEPSPHARAAISCAECHRLDTRAGAFLDVQPTCMACHKETPLKGELYDDWQETLAVQAFWLAGQIVGLESVEHRTPKDDQLLTRLRKADRLLRGEGMHNVHAARAMYDSLRKELSATSTAPGSD